MLCYVVHNKTQNNAKRATKKTTQLTDVQVHPTVNTVPMITNDQTDRLIRMLLFSSNLNFKTLTPKRKPNDHKS